MKYDFLAVILIILQSVQSVRGQAPTQTANTYVRPYTEKFQYGTNLGYYGAKWTDEKLAGITQTLGGHTLRVSLPDAFVERYGYTIREDAFTAYTTTYGMKELTCFVGEPSVAHRDPATYPGATGQSKLFAHLYEPIWNSDGSVNANNYYASYLYNLLLVYGDKVRIWEVVNEPDYSTLSSKDVWLSRAPTPGETHNLKAPFYHYVRMLRISYEVIKRYRPEAYVTPGGLGYTPFLDALLRYTDNPNGGTVTAQYPNKGGAYFDMLSYHFYPSYELHYWDTAAGIMRYNRTSDYAAGKVMKHKQAMTSVLSRYRYTGTSTTYPLKPLLLTETNVNRRTAQTLTGSDEMQRSFGVKTMVLAQKNDIKQLYFFNLGETIDAPAAGQTIPISDEFNLMGFYENLKRDAPGAQKLTPLGQAFTTTTTLLYGFRYDAARTLALALPTNLEGAAFEKNGSYVYVLWAKALIDKSEAARGTYSFPAAWNINTVQRYEWNYATTRMQVPQAPRNIALTGSPSFFVGNTPAQVASCTGTGTMLREQWDNVAGSLTATIPVTTAPTKSSQLPDFEASAVTGYNYGARLRGYLCPPQTGAYTFWVTGNDAAELALSPDADPSRKVRLATSSGWTSSAHDWFRSPAQQSAPVVLQAGQRYYVEVLHKQGWGPGYVAVGWQLPDGVQQLPIPGASLVPFGAVASPSSRGSSALAILDQKADAGSSLRIYPNPMNEQATVQVRVAQAGPVTVSLYSLNGQLVRTLLAGSLAADTPRMLTLETTGLRNGLYVVRLTTAGEVITQKVSYSAP